MNLVINCQTGEQNLVALSASEIVERDANEQERIVEEAALPMKNLRQRRNQLLAETDWVTIQAIDASVDGFGVQLPMDWMNYRQALRDLPANTVDPANPVWPTKPGGN